MISSGNVRGMFRWRGGLRTFCGLHRTAAERNGTWGVKELTKSEISPKAAGPSRALVPSLPRGLVAVSGQWSGRERPPGRRRGIERLADDRAGRFPFSRGDATERSASVPYRLATGTTARSLWRAPRALRASPRAVRNVETKSRTKARPGRGASKGHSRSAHRPSRPRA